MISLLQDVNTTGWDCRQQRAEVLSVSAGSARCPPCLGQRGEHWGYWNGCVCAGGEEKGMEGAEKGLPSTTGRLLQRKQTSHSSQGKLPWLIFQPTVSVPPWLLILQSENIKYKINFPILSGFQFVNVWHRKHSSEVRNSSHWEGLLNRIQVRHCFLPTGGKNEKQKKASKYAPHP